MIGGDVDTPGAFADALAVIQKGRLRETGIEEIGIGAYPEGLWRRGLRLAARHKTAILLIAAYLVVRMVMLAVLRV